MPMNLIDPEKEFRGVEVKHSYYELTCLCGTTVTTRESPAVCRKCKREISFAWRPEHDNGKA